MAEIKEYIKKIKMKDGSFKNKTFYMFNLYLGVDPLTGKKKRTTRRGFATIKEAKFEMLQLELKAKTQGIQPASKKTFIQLYDMYIKSYKNTVKESTYAYNIQLYEKYVLPHFSNILVSKITLSYCQNIIEKWSVDVPKRYRRIKNLASKVFDYGVSLELLENNPMSKVIIPTKFHEDLLIVEEKETFYSKEELTYFLRCAEELGYSKYLFFRILAFTGIRKGEALALTWKDIDFKNKSINIDKTLARGVKGRLLVQTPKTKKSIRKIEVDNTTISFLKKWKIMQNSITLKTDYIFSNEKGNLMQPSAPAEWMESLLSRYSDLKKIKIHGFRHTHCSLLFESGATLKEVQDRLGHGDIKTTMNIYAHVTESAKSNVANSFAKYMES